VGKIPGSESCCGRLVIISSGNDNQQCAFEFDIAGEDINAQFDSVAAKRAQEVWRAKGPIGKLNNLVVSIRASAQRSEAFRKIQIGDDKIDSK